MFKNKKFRARSRRRNLTHGIESIRVQTAHAERKNTVTGNQDDDKDTLLSAEPSNFSHIRHVESPGRNVKKHPIPPRRPVYTATKVSIAGFTVRGLENEISYVQQDWPLVALKELGDNPYDFFGANESLPVLQKGVLNS